tara:strand:+ start:424 stop:735 length:312 start_codon:yes stop_codon:yes gene_type:complete
MKKVIKKVIVKRQVDPAALFDAGDVSGEGVISYNDLQRTLSCMRLGFSAREYYEVVRLADPDNIGYVFYILEESMVVLFLVLSGVSNIIFSLFNTEILRKRRF